MTTTTLDGDLLYDADVPVPGTEDEAIVPDLLVEPVGSEEEASLLAMIQEVVSEVGDVAYNQLAAGQSRQDVFSALINAVGITIVEVLAQSGIKIRKDFILQLASLLCAVVANNARNAGILLRSESVEDDDNAAAPVPNAPSSSAVQ